MKKVRCPICSNEEVSRKKNRKTPSDFGFENFEGYSIFSCSTCLGEFAYPRKSMEYYDISKKYKVYSRFNRAENFEGQIFHTVNCTAHWKDSPIMYYIISNILSYLNSQAHFLDFGAGSGYMTELARRLGYKVSALEASCEFRKFISKTIPDVTVYESLDEVIKQDKFDVISAMHVIEHLPYPIEYLKRLNSILSDQSMLIVVVPNLDRAYNRFGEIGKEIENDIEWNGFPGDFPPHHLTRFRSETMRIALKRSGFKNIAIGYSSVNAWDLFYTGLGDDTFKFKNYSSDILQMKSIALVERRLNEMLSHFDLENLGNSLIALASNSISQTIMEELIRKSREEVLNKYVSNVLEQYKQFQEMKRYHEEEKNTYIKSLESTLQEKDSSINSLESTLQEKDSSINSLESTLQEKDSSINSLESTLQEKDSSINSLESTLQEKDKYNLRISTELNLIKSSVTWRTVMKWHSFIEKLMPPMTRRRKWYDRGIIRLRTIANEGWGSFRWKYKEHQGRKKK